MMIFAKDLSGNTTSIDVEGISSILEVKKAFYQKHFNIVFARTNDAKTAFEWLNKNCRLVCNIGYPSKSTLLDEHYDDKTLYDLNIYKDALFHIVARLVPYLGPLRGNLELFDKHLNEGSVAMGAGLRCTALPREITEEVASYVSKQHVDVGRVMAAYDAKKSTTGWEKTGQILFQNRGMFRSQAQQFATACEQHKATHNDGYGPGAMVVYKPL